MNEDFPPPDVPNTTIFEFNLWVLSQISKTIGLFKLLSPKYKPFGSINNESWKGKLDANVFDGNCNPYLYKLVLYFGNMEQKTFFCTKLKSFKLIFSFFTLSFKIAIFSCNDFLS